MAWTQRDRICTLKTLEGELLYKEKKNSKTILAVRLCAMCLFETRRLERCHQKSSIYGLERRGRMPRRITDML